MYRINPIVAECAVVGTLYYWKLQRSVRLFGRHIFWWNIGTFDSERDALRELDITVKTGKTRAQRDYEDEQVAKLAHLAGRKIYNEQGVQTWP